jgi:hypothetical protein
VHLIHKRERRNVDKLLVEKHEGKTVEGRDVRAKLILQCIVKQYDGRVWTGFTWSRI